ncbi:MAG TPA: hypothetical protein VMW44_00455 [Candidatus Bathyarchaeia archaeon]|nr:hypothetical protein [Candidatus Bathyarchaeia archaeon]
MINEFSCIEKGLVENKIPIVIRSDAIKNATKNPGFIFSFNPQNGVVGVEFVQPDDMTKRWKVAETKFKSFPIMNLNEPLYRLIDSDAECLAIELSMVLRDNKFIDFLTYSFGLYEINLNSDSKHIKRFTDFCYFYPKSLFERFADNGSQSTFFRLSKSLCEWFGKSPSKNKLQERGEQFATQLATTLCKNYLLGRLEDADAVARALFGRWNSGERIFEKPGIQFGLCLEGERDNSFSDSYQKINEALLSESSSQLIGNCALTGKQEPLITKTFPEITLKGVGQTRLFSMFKEIPAQFRYGRSGAEIFPVSEAEIRKIANALQTICAPEQEGRTWRTIPSTKPKKSDLLIAWLSGKRAVEQNEAVRDAMAQLCASPSTLDAISQYEAHLREVINSFTRPDAGFSFDDVQRILILTQVDPSRREIVANLTYQMESVAQGVSNWAQLAGEHIHFKIPVKFPGDRNVVSLPPYIPSPASVMDVFRKLYLQCGRVEATQGIAAKKVFDILLKPAFGQMALENVLLQRLLMNVSELLINLRSDQIISSQLWQNGKKREAEKVLKPYSTTARLDALVSISFFEILLGRLEKEKRRYLMTATYQLGKLLAKADELHLAYSHEVRKEDIPSQLLGNSLVRIAMSTPVQALERLGERIVVYQNWAKVHHERTNDSHIGMLLSQIGRTAERIDLSELEQTVTPKTKAALLLGYLAWETSKKSSDGGE